MVNISVTPRPVLLVEDSDDDALLMRRAFDRAGLQNTLVHAADGESAIEYLQGCIANQHPLPILVLLDIKMPRMDGFETLNWIKSRPEIVDVPVVMLTSSNMEQDIQRSKRLGADSFLTKPPTLEDLTAMVQRLEKSWLIVD